MKQFIIPIISGIVGIIIPVAGITITPTRDLILGLAPDEAVLQLADKIDENRINFDTKMVGNEQKIIELQSIIDDQKIELSNYKQQVESQNVKITEIKSGNQIIQTQVDKQTECSKLYGEQPLCQSDTRYRTKDKFEKMLDELEISKDEKYRRTKIFNKCQEIISKCG